jgi:hypothetical protein
MSKRRAKKKQRQRARAASGPGRATPEERAAAGGERATPEERAATGGEPGKPQERAAPRDQTRATAPGAGPRRPSRLDVREGVPRPDAIWAPFPLTEIGMAVGLVLVALGYMRSTPALFLAGVGVLVVVVGELCLREHLCGFRSHSILLGLLPVTTVHLAVVYAGGVTWRGPPAVAVDLVVAGALAWWLQRRFVAAQGRARVVGR